jgi:hypothetical protein
MSLGLGKTELGKLNAKLDMLVTSGGELPPGLLSDSSSRTIKKIRINGTRALRLFLCRGPTNVQTEFTLLHGCIEKDRAVPKGSIEIAEDRRTGIVENRFTRVIHERVNFKT